MVKKRSRLLVVLTLVRSVHVQLNGLIVHVGLIGIVCESVWHCV